LLNLCTLLVLLLCRIGNSTCPYKCQCFTELQVLCADERMSSLPRDISRQVREVIIMTSSLAYLFSNSLMESPQLTKLIFLNNALKSIHLTAFEHLTELQELELSGNPNLDHLYLGTFSKQEKLNKLLLNYNSLETILPGLFDPLTQLEVLQMKSNVLSDLPPFLFRNLSSLLEILKLGNNLIGNLTSETFRNTSQLTELHLEWNEIAQLDDGIFSALANLSVLNLRGNRLTSFANKAFGGEPTNLKELNLKGNRLTELSLESLSSLTDLTLSDNQLSSLTENLFRNLTSLERLDLSDNQLTSLPEGIFKDLLSIEVINLHNNNLTELDSKLFQDQLLLKSLYLSDNQLETLQLGLFDNFILRPTVRLHGNPWRCECQLWYLHDWLIQNLQDVELLDLVACERPDSLRKRTLVSIRRDQLVCHRSADWMPEPNSCSLQVSNDTVVVRCSVEKCSPMTVKVQFQEENSESRRRFPLCTARRTDGCTLNTALTGG
uniref:LRRCT domain-containing protein n=1 Tax=Poecilia latipinna TaxID=48699 RepID=A0A3B3VMH5_9TELE